MFPERNLRLLAWFRFFSGLRFSAALLAIYYARVSGSYALGMSTFSVMSTAQILFDVPTGIISDTAARRRVIIAGAVVSLGVTICFAVGLDYWFLFAGAVLQGLAWALFSGNNAAFLYETLAAQDRLDRYPTVAGRMEAYEQAAFAVGAAAGSAMASVSLHLAFWASLAPQSVALVLCFFLIEPPRRQMRDGRTRTHLAAAFRHLRAHRPLRLLTSVTAYNYAISESAYQFHYAFIQQVWPTWAIGLGGTLSSGGAAFSFFFSGRVLARLSPLRALRGQVLVDRTLNVAALAAPGPASPVLMSLTSLTYGPAEIAKDTLQQQYFSDEQRATLGSIVSVMANLGYAVVAILVGIAADHLGAVKTLLAVQALLVLPYWVLPRVFGSDPRARSATR